MREFSTHEQVREIIHATYFASAISAALNFGDTESDIKSDGVSLLMVEPDETRAAKAVHGWLPLKMKKTLILPQIQQIYCHTYLNFRRMSLKYEIGFLDSGQGPCLAAIAN